MGGLGEIWIVDAISGNFVRELVDNTDGHRQVVVSLAWAPDGSRRLLSADVDGKVILWQADPDTGLWSHRTILNDDRATYGDAWAEALKPFRDFVPIAWSGPNAVIVPRLVGVLKEPANALHWNLVRIDLTGNVKESRLKEPSLVRSARIFAGSVDGKHWLPAIALEPQTLFDSPRTGRFWVSKNWTQGRQLFHPL